MKVEMNSSGAIKMLCNTGCCSKCLKCYATPSVVVIVVKTKKYGTQGVVVDTRY
jgi:hypothetical protein